MLRVDIAPLDEGLHELHLTPTPESLGLDDGAFSDIAVDLRLTIADGRVVADFDARATAALICDRTAAPFEQKVDGSHSVLFTAGPIGDDDEDVYPLEDGARTISLAEPVRDTLVLALPLRRVAPDAVDAEIPTVFGAAPEGDLADDRWAALRGLRGDADSTD